MSDLIKVNQMPKEFYSLAQSIPNCRAAAYSGPTKFLSKLMAKICPWWLADQSWDQHGMLLIEQPPTVRRLKIADSLRITEIDQLDFDSADAVRCTQLSEVALPYVYFVLIVYFNGEWSLRPYYGKTFWRQSAIEDKSDLLQPSLMMNTYQNGDICFGDCLDDLNLCKDQSLANQIDIFLDCYWSSLFTCNLASNFYDSCGSCKPFINLLDWVAKTEADPKFILKEEWLEIECRAFLVSDLTAWLAMIIRQIAT